MGEHRTPAVASVVPPKRSAQATPRESGSRCWLSGITAATAKHRGGSARGNLLQGASYITRPTTKLRTVPGPEKSAKGVCTNLAEHRLPRDCCGSSSRCRRDPGPGTPAHRRRETAPHTGSALLPRLLSSKRSIKQMKSVIASYITRSDKAFTARAVEIHDGCFAVLMRRSRTSSMSESGRWSLRKAHLLRSAS